MSLVSSQGTERHRPGLSRKRAPSLTVATSAIVLPQKEVSLPSLPVPDQLYFKAYTGAPTGMFLLHRGSRAAGLSSRFRPPRL